MRHGRMDRLHRRRDGLCCAGGIGHRGGRNGSSLLLWLDGDQGARVHLSATDL